MEYTIKKLAELAGVSTRTLRYYDEIGILPPVYVDPETKYRYYAISQLYIVEAIKFCVELDIPLRDFSKYLSPRKNRIYYSKLIEDGRKIAMEKINIIEERINMLYDVQKYMTIAEAKSKGTGQKSCLIEGKYIFVKSCKKILSKEEYDIGTKKLLIYLNDKGIQIGNESGSIFLYDNDEVKRYIYVEVVVNEETTANYSEIMYIPEGSYICETVKFGEINNIEKKFQNLFNKDYPKIVFEAELWLGKFDFLNPAFELRCSLPK